MAETFPETFKRFLLLRLTKELIKNSPKTEFIKLKGILASEEKRMPFIPKRKEIKRELPVRRPILTRTRNVAPVQKENIPQRVQARPRIVRPILRPLFIPEPKLPAHLEYLKPIPTPTEIDLGRLNPFIKDPAVKIIEANPDENAVVTGAMGTKPTDVVLSKEDIDGIINKFSEMAKIPVTEGIYRVVVGNLELVAIVSEVVGSRINIKKITAPPAQPQAPPSKFYKPAPQIPQQTPQIIPRNPNPFIK